MISINMSACSPKSSILSYGAFIEGNQTTFKIHAPVHLNHPSFHTEPLLKEIKLLLKSMRLDQPKYIW